jgi:molybdate transport system ATP-binding protein
VVIAPATALAPPPSGSLDSGEPPWTIRVQLHRPDFTLDIDLALPKRGFTVMMGPSGAGKTTVLRAVAGLDTDARCLVRVGHDLWQDDFSTGTKGLARAIHERPLGYVFQEARLFPHLTVAQNLHFARRTSTPRAPSAELTSDDLIDALGLTDLLTRRPSELSGGQRQRVALGRALLSGCHCLLLDEPLASLDAPARRSLMSVIASWRGRLSVPALYVTHAPLELLHLADHAVWLEDGRAWHADLENFLLDTRIAHRLGTEAGAVVNATVSSRDAQWGLAQLESAGTRWLVPDPGLSIGRVVRLFLRADDVGLSCREGAQDSLRNDLAGTIDAIEADTHDALLLVRVRVGGNRLWSRLTRHAANTLALAEGLAVHVRIKASALMILPE